MTELEQAASDLLTRLGYASRISLRLLPGGTNNRVYRVDTDERPFLLKAYFRHVRDGRDRLGVEFAFSRYAWDLGLQCLPEPLAFDPTHGLGLYEFIEGRQLSTDEVTERDVQDALDFCLGLNRGRDLPEAQALPPASDSCFSLGDYIAGIERRVERLQQIPPSSAIGCDARRFVEGELSATAQEIVAALLRCASELGYPTDETLPPHERYLSPSDFGFHNAIVTPTGVRFVDFEYAGWDDPAKLVSDFFGQFEVEVPMRYFDTFADAVAAGLPRPDWHRRRTELVLPICRLKWCCIILNVFLPVASDRRRFANAAPIGDEDKAKQLMKARRALGDLHVTSHPR